MINNWYQNYIINSIKESSGATLPMIIKDLIKTETSDSERMRTLWEEYKGNVPIKTSSSPDNPAKPSNRIANDFRGQIVDQITGYMFGVPVKYILDSENQAEIELLENFLKVNFYEKLDSELENYISVCGKGFRLYYYADIVTHDGKEKIEVISKNIKPYEAAVITDGTIDEVTYGMIYYKVEVNENSKKAWRYRVEWYDNLNVYYYMENASGHFVPDTTYGPDYIQPHGFNFVPLVKFSNNILEMGDFEKVRTNIDSYDKTISFSINDMESFANAYLLFYGVEPSAEVLAAARKSGAFYIPTDTESGQQPNKVEFLTKNIQIQNVTETAKLLSNDIYKFSSTIDMSDENFSGAAQTGESRKWKLLPLEWKAKQKERFFMEGLQRQFKLLSSFWRLVYGISVNPDKIKYVFTRSMPVDLSIQDLVLLKNAQILSTETAVSRVPGVSSPEEEVERVRQEMIETGRIFNLGLPDEQPTTE